jgi:predicted nucleic acid-binding protein
VSESVVADTTCLIALERIGQLDLLQRLFFSVLIPPEVAREFNTQFGLSVIGTIGLLVMAKKRGLIRTVRPFIEDLERYGFYMTEALKQEVFRLADE